jgi:anthranilate synthase component 2
MILIIDNYDSFTYNLYQIFAKIDKNTKVVRNNLITIYEIREMNPCAVILSPGPGRPESAGICIDMIRELHKELPMFGVCLGHQAIVVAFGGEVVIANETVHGKSANIFHCRAGIFKDMPLPFSAGRYHSLVIKKERLPAELIITAENEKGLIMGIKHVKYPVYGVQFHPESILTPDGETLIMNFLREAGVC